jgi:hypothetical protein
MGQTQSGSPRTESGAAPSKTLRRLHVKLFNAMGSEGTIETKLRDVFKAVDSDNDGFLTALELETAGTNCGVPLSTDKLKEVIGTFDTRADGTVDFEKICNVFRADTPPSPVEPVSPALRKSESEPANSIKQKLVQAKVLDDKLNVDTQGHQPQPMTQEIQKNASPKPVVASPMPVAVPAAEPAGNPAAEPTAEPAAEPAAASVEILSPAPPALQSVDELEESTAVQSPGKRIQFAILPESEAAQKRSPKHDVGRASIELRSDLLHRKSFQDSVREVGVLGVGAFGNVTLIVYRGSKFACKQLLAASQDNEDHKVQLVNEKNHLTAITHPFILRLHTSVEEQGNLTLLLEWMPGGDLYMRMKQHKRETGTACGLKPEDVTFYSAGIILAVEHLHTLQIVHRDLKPENMLIDKHGFAVLADFGFAKKLPYTVTDENGTQVSKDRAMSFVGSPLYMPPEGILKKGLDITGDIWAFAVTVYELLTSLCLFNDVTDPGNLTKIFTLVLVSGKKGIPWKDGFVEQNSVAADMIKSCLAYKAEDRATAAGLKQHAFFKDIDWEQFNAKKPKAPYVPQLQTPKQAETKSA